MKDEPQSAGHWQDSRDALLRATVALTVDQRLDWLEEMIAIAVESGALPKRVPDEARDGGADSADHSRSNRG